jgi:hypothetical protein
VGVDISMERTTCARETRVRSAITYGERAHSLSVWGGAEWRVQS